MIFSGGRGFKPNPGPISLLTANAQMDLGLYFILKLTTIREDLAYRAELSVAARAQESLSLFKSHILHQKSPKKRLVILILIFHITIFLSCVFSSFICLQSLVISSSNYE